jgi:hypothetical protein
MMSFRLFLPEDAHMIAGLNLYSRKSEAFDDVAETVGLLLATYGALAVSGKLARDRADNPLKALESNREIAAAAAPTRLTHVAKPTPGHAVARR